MNFVPTVSRPFYLLLLGSCDPEELRPDGNVEMSFIPAVDRPSNGGSSVSHPEKGSSSKREEPWERYASPLRGDVPQTDHYLDYSGGVVQEEVPRPQTRKHLQVVGSSRRVGDNTGGIASGGAVVMIKHKSEAAVALCFEIIIESCVSCWQTAVNAIL